MWWLLIPAIILSILLYLLFAPVLIEVNSEQGYCRFRYHKLAFGSLEQKEQTFIFTLRIAWWKKEYDLFQLPQTKPATNLIEKKVSKKKRSSSIRKMPQRIVAVLKSFRLISCYITIDTGNMPLNGMLYPWFYLLGARINKTVMINFWGENEIRLKIKNSVARMMWAFVRIK